MNSTALIMTGSDSIGDALVDVSILIAIIVYNALKIDLEPWLSLLISILLIKTGVEMIRECANKLLGSRADPELIRNVKRQAARVPGVRSVFNLVIHNYGEGVLVGSVDIAVDNSMSVEESTGLVRKIKRRSEELGVRMASVGIYGISLSNPDHAVMWDQILSAVGAHPEFARAYAFSYDAEENTAYFIVTMSTNARNDTDAVRRLSAELEQRFPGISFSIDMSVDT